MAVRLNANVSKVLELDEYVAFVEENVDLADFDCLCETAWALKALANNRTFLSHAVNGQLRDRLDGRSPAQYTANSIVFSRGRFHSIRANIWEPLCADPRRSELQAPLFTYFNCHDHNFHFVTTAFSGPGYESDLYEYDRATVTGAPGEEVDLQFIERVRFQAGDLMAYRAFSDAHVQHPPTEMSVSLNLVATSPEMAMRRQFLFDTDTHRLQDRVDNTDEKAAKFIQMAAHLGDANTIELLLTLAESHPLDAIRQTAQDELRRMLPADREYVDARLRHAAPPRVLELQS
jgi:hypothetical protein